MNPIRVVRPLLLSLASFALASPLLAADTHPDKLIGRWQLTQLDGKAPPRFLQEKLLVLQGDGTIRTEDLKPTGKSAVLEAAATAVQTGKWRLADGRLFVSNSPWKDGAPVSFAPNALQFERDPYISDNGKQSQTTYKRVP